MLGALMLAGWHGDTDSLQDVSNKAFSIKGIGTFSAEVRLRPLQFCGLFRWLLLETLASLWSDFLRARMGYLRIGAAMLFVQD